MPPPASHPPATTHFAATKAAIANLTRWSLIVLVLSVWPFVSAMPLFSLVHAPGDALNIAVQLAFFGTGFWSLAVLLATVEWVRIKPQPDTFAAVRRRLLPGAAAFGAVWMIIYGAAKHLGYA
jgi:hypothetical protein